MIEKCIHKINQHHALLVFPLKNRAEPLSLWKCLYPRIEMKWAWDENADNRVAKLWLLREELSRSHKVIYSKWFQNRATLFSKELFIQLLAYSQTPVKDKALLSREARRVLDALEMDSPLSTKQLKEITELQGRRLEPLYNKVMKELWSKLWIVAFGEFDDSSFPSLGIGSTQVLFEDEWREAKNISKTKAEKNIHLLLKEAPVFEKQIFKVL